MTTGTPLEGTPADLRAWTAAQLGVSPADSAADLRGTVVQRLADEDFLPPWRWQQALAVAQRPAEAAERVRGHGQADLDEENRLRNEVGALAAEFFALKPAERRGRWEILNAACAPHLALAAWFRSLKPGLDVEPSSGPFTSHRLEEHIRDLFVMRPVVRAHRRAALLQEMHAELSAWEAAASKLLHERPAVAALEPILVHRLQNGRAAEKKHVRWAATQRAPAPSGNGSSEGTRWPMWLVIFLAINVVRGCVGLSSRPASAPPVYVPPRQSIDDVDSILERIRPAEQQQRPGERFPPDPRRPVDPPFGPSKDVPSTRPSAPRP